MEGLVLCSGILSSVGSSLWGAAVLKEKVCLAPQLVCQGSDVEESENWLLHGSPQWLSAEVPKPAPNPSDKSLGKHQDAVPQNPELADLGLKPSPTQCCSATPISACAGICAQQIHLLAWLLQTSLSSPALLLAVAKVHSERSKQHREQAASCLSSLLLFGS